MIKKKIYFGEALSIIAAFQLYLASGYVKDNFAVVFCIENLITTLAILIIFGPFLVKDIALKKIIYSQSEYFSSGIIALVEYSTWYKGAGLISLKVGLAAKGICYPMSLMLMLMFMRTIRGNSAKNYVLMVIALVNIVHSLDYSDDGFFDVFGGAIYLFFYVISSVSSDFITVCMTNRSGLARFMFANSFYLGICSLFLLVSFDVESSDINTFISKNLCMLVLLGVISVVSKVFSAFYIQKFGIVAYSTTKISCYIYFIIIKNILKNEDGWELEGMLCYLTVYMGSLVSLDSDETHERALGLVM